MKYIITATVSLIFGVSLWSSLKGQPVLPPIVLSPFSLGSVELRDEKKDSKEDQEENNK
jgi:hypothetical protein